MSNLKPIYEGMYAFSRGEIYYNLHGDIFTDALKENISQTTGLRASEWLPDWWVGEQDNPVLSWKQLITLALNILHCEATRLFVYNLHLKQIPTGYTVNTDAALPRNAVTGAKRINAYSGVIPVYNQVTRGEDTINAGTSFRLSGKDESCCVEGTWLDWCCFACNVLASPNTEAMCPDLYEPALENNNY